jgi:maltose/maltodextrin transport system permease protein
MKQVLLINSTVYRISILAITFVFLFVAVFFWRLNETVYSLFALAIAAVFAITFLLPKFYNYRFMFPALLALFLVIVVPVLHMIGLSFTNLSESNKLNYRRALPYIATQTYVADNGISMNVSGWADNDRLNIFLWDDDSETWLGHSDSVSSMIMEAATIQMRPIAEDPSERFDRKFAIAFRNQLDLLTLTLPNGVELTKNKLRSFAERKLRFVELSEGEFRDQMTGDRILANHQTGEFEIVESDDSDRLGGFISPTFLKQNNFTNYLNLLKDTGQMKIFSLVFLWSVFAATFTVTTTFFVSLAIANLLSWPAIREREMYKIVIIACYALPAFAVINAFFWMFTTHQAPWGAELIPGPIYGIVDNLFGLKLDWQYDPSLARIKFLIVQFWMFMPFMLIMCLGVIQGIPQSLYEAARLEGAGTRKLFFKITLPLTFIPLAPVLIIAFATAFNDLSLVDQLIVGVPEIPGSAPLAAYPDLLVSYANRQAFGNAYTRGAGFGFYSLASTLFTIIFIILACISALYLRVIQFRSTGKEF